MIPYESNQILVLLKKDVFRWRAQSNFRSTHITKLTLNNNSVWFMSDLFFFFIGWIERWLYQRPFFQTITVFQIPWTRQCLACWRKCKFTFNFSRFNSADLFLFQISFVDFILYEMLDQHSILVHDCLDSFPNLKAYCEKFRSLEPIKAYMSSADFITRPLNNPHAGFK